MATFREIAEYISTLPEEIQEQEAIFASILDDTFADFGGRNIKEVKIRFKIGGNDVLGISERVIKEAIVIVDDDDEVETEYDWYL